MSTKTIPANERVQVVTQRMLERDAFTIRAAEDGPDIRIYASEDDEGNGIPFRADDEIPVPEEDGWGGLEHADGLWMETDTASSTTVTVLKGVALRRNVRRRNTVQGTNGVLTTSTSGVVQTDNYEEGGAFDYNGTAYPYTVDPAETIEELVITTSGDIVARITTTSGTTFDLPLAGGSGTFDKWSIDVVEFQDPNATGDRIAGGWAGE